MKRRQTKPHCPRCRQRVAYDAPDFPFCSRRCRLVDLGRWLDGDYRVAGEKVSLTDEPDNEPLQ